MVTTYTHRSGGGWGECLTFVRFSKFVVLLLHVSGQPAQGLRKRLSSTERNGIGEAAPVISACYMVRCLFPHDVFMMPP